MYRSHDQGPSPTL